MGRRGVLVDGMTAVTWMSPWTHLAWCSDKSPCGDLLESGGCEVDFLLSSEGQGRGHAMEGSWGGEILANSLLSLCPTACWEEAGASYRAVRAQPGLAYPACSPAGVGWLWVCCSLVLEWAFLLG